MRTYTRLWMIIAGAVLMIGIVTANVMAAATPSGAPGAAHRQKMRGEFAAFIKTLNLTKDQRAQLKPIVQAARADVKAVRVDKSLKPAEKHEKIRTIRQDMLAKVRPILTTDQQTMLDAFIQHLKDMKAHAKGPKA